VGESADAPGLLEHIPLVSFTVGVGLGVSVSVGVGLAVSVGVGVGADVGVGVVGADVVGGAVVVGGRTGAVVVASAVVVAVGAGAVVVAVGAVVGVVVAPLATVKFARRLELVPSDHVSTALMRCDPSASFFVSYGTAVPSAAVPAKSKGGSVSVRTGRVSRQRLSR